MRSPRAGAPVPCTLRAVWSLRPSVPCAVATAVAVTIAGPATGDAAAEPTFYEIGADIPGIVLEQARPAPGGGFGWRKWSRSPDVWIQIRDTAVTSGEQEACVLRLRRTGAPDTEPPLHEWRSPDAEGGTGPCTGIAPSGAVHLPGPWTEGTHPVELVAFGRGPSPEGRRLARVDIGVDDSGPTVRWPGLPSVVPGGTRIKAIPETEDLSGVWSTGRWVTDDLGRSVPVSAEDGTAIVPPGRTITIHFEAGDAAGDAMTAAPPGVHLYPNNRTVAEVSVRGLGLPSELRAPIPRAPVAPVAAPLRCGSGSRASARWAVRDRRLVLSGCRTAGAVRVQVRSVSRGRTVTRTMRIGGDGGRWARRLRVASGDRPRTVRSRSVGSRTWSAWRRVVRG